MKLAHTFLLSIFFCVLFHFGHGQEYNAKNQQISELLDSATALQESQKYTQAGTILRDLERQIEPDMPMELKYGINAQLASHLFQSRNPQESQIYAKKSLKLAEKLGDSVKIASSCSRIGNNYTLMGKPQKAIECFEKIKDYLRKNNPTSYNGVLLNMANAYERLNQPDKVLKNLTEAKAYFTEKENLTNIAIIENNIGELYRQRLNDPEQAAKHYRRAIALNKKINERASLSQNYHNLSVLHLDGNALDSAQLYAEKSLILKQEIGDLGGMTSTYYTLGSINARLGNFEPARLNYQKSLEQSYEYGLGEGIFYNSQGLGELYLERGNINKAIPNFKRALQKAEEIGSMKLQSAALGKLVESHKQAKDFQSALNFQERLLALKDSSQEMLAEQNLSELRTQYETDITEAENAILRERELAQNQEIENQRIQLYYSIAFIGLLILAAILLIMALRQRKKALVKEQESKTKLKDQYQKVKEHQQKLQAANDLKNKILSVLGHDLRSPLSSVSGLLSTMSATEITREELQEMLKLLHQETKLSLKTLHDILNWARLQMQEVNYEKEAVDPERFLGETLAVYEPNIRAKSLSTQLKNSSNIQLWADRNQLRSIFSNLLSNAIKYSPVGGTITIELDKTKGYNLLVISDEGKGMSEEVLKNLNSRNKILSQSGTKGEVGSGIGLRIVQDFVEAHNGKLKFATNAVGGTSVTVMLPVASANPKEKTQIVNQDQET